MLVSVYIIYNKIQITIIIKISIAAPLLLDGIFIPQLLSALVNVRSVLFFKNIINHIV